MKIILLVPVLCLLIISCGGGGGGGGEENLPPVLATDGRDEQALDLAGNVALFGFSLTEGLVELGQFSAKNLLFKQLEYLEKTRGSVDACVEGERTISELIDHDRNYAVSAGDQLNLTFSNCRSDIAWQRNWVHAYSD